jgi:hypothetical protein
MLQSNRAHYSIYGILFQGENMFVIRHGKRIAKRNQQTKTWIPIRARLASTDDGHTMEIVYQRTWSLGRKPRLVAGVRVGLGSSGVPSQR